MLRFTGEPESDMFKTNLQQRISVNALPSKVWKVLTHSEYVNQYFSNNIIHCDWVEESPILLISGKDKIPVNVGQVLESVPGLLLKFRFWEENIYLTNTYELIVSGDGVELKMKCEGFTATKQEFLARIQQANLVLKKIKWLAEYN